MTANELDIQVSDLVHRYDPLPVIQNYMKLVGQGQINEVLDQNALGGNRYYQWLACLIRLIKPKQVVELGPAAGISTTMMLSELPKDSKLISVDIDPELAWKWMDRQWPQETRILGDDLDLSIYPKDLDLSKTDIWFMDTLHTEEHLRKELELYSQFWKEGTIVVLDDIALPSLRAVWEDITYDKCETTQPNHFSGFGHFIT